MLNQDYFITGVIFIFKTLDMKGFTTREDAINYCKIWLNLFTKVKKLYKEGSNSPTYKLACVQIKFWQGALQDMTNHSTQYFEQNVDQIMKEFNELAYDFYH